MQRVMSKKSTIYTLFLFVFALVGLCACVRDDAEPTGVARQFTRLYVSFEDAPVPNPTIPYVNMGVIYPADSTDLFTFRLSFGSAAQGGGPIVFNPYSRNVYQASANLNGAADTVVYSLGVGTTGALSASGVIPNRLFSYVKGLSFDAINNRLIIVNGNGTNTTSGIYVVSSPVGRTSYTRPLKKFFTNGKLLWGTAYYNDQLFVSQLNAPIGITVFDQIISTDVSASADSSAVLNSYTLPIAGAETGMNLRGVSYDHGRDILVVAAYPTTPTPSVVGNGRIYIFENFHGSLTGSARTITPTRTITGAATQLAQPVEVAIDTRENGSYLYVADRQARSIFRFNMSDNGNVAPNQALETPGGRIPVGLALDTRDRTTLDNSPISQ